MSWSRSLIRISTYEVETLQKRLAEIADRRLAAEAAVGALDAEAHAETEQARRCLDAARAHPGYLVGWRARRLRAEGTLDTVRREEEGARDALSAAFEELKKFEHLAELARVAALKERAKRDAASLDELGLRRAANGR